jgi:hypothetical protein
MTHLRLTLDVEIETNGEPIESLIAILEDIPRHAASEGLLTASTCAEVASWTCRVEHAPEPIRITMEVEGGAIVDCTANQPVDVMILDHDLDEPVVKVLAVGRPEVQRAARESVDRRRLNSETSDDTAQFGEEQIAELMLARIESGDLALEDIPKRLARFGLMNPADFLAEMQERWEHQQAEGS